MHHPCDGFPPDLQALIDLWPELDPDTRRRLLALARVRGKKE